MYAKAIFIPSTSWRGGKRARCFPPWKIKYKGKTWWLPGVLLQHFSSSNFVSWYLPDCGKLNRGFFKRTASLYPIRGRKINPLQQDWFTLALHFCSEYSMLKEKRWGPIVCSHMTSFSSVIGQKTQALSRKANSISGNAVYRLDSFHLRFYLWLRLFRLFFFLTGLDLPIKTFNRIPTRDLTCVSNDRVQV